MSFVTVQNRIDAMYSVSGLLGTIRTIHAHAAELKAARDLYVAGTNPTFNAAFDALFNTAADRNEISTMIADVVALCITNWEQSHAAALGL